MGEKIQQQRYLCHARIKTRLLNAAFYRNFYKGYRVKEYLSCTDAVRLGPPLIRKYNAHTRNVWRCPVVTLLQLYVNYEMHIYIFFVSVYLRTSFFWGVVVPWLTPLQLPTAKVCVATIGSLILATTAGHLLYTHQGFLPGLVVLYLRLLGRAWWCCSIEPKIVMHIHVIHPFLHLGSARFLCILLRSACFLHIHLDSVRFLHIRAPGHLALCHTVRHKGRHKSLTADLKGVPFLVLLLPALLVNLR